MVAGVVCGTRDAPDSGATQRAILPLDLALGTSPTSSTAHTESPLSARLWDKQSYGRCEPPAVCSIQAQIRPRYDTGNCTALSAPSNSFGPTPNEWFTYRLQAVCCMQHTAHYSLAATDPVVICRGRLSSLRALAQAPAIQASHFTGNAGDRLRPASRPLSHVAPVFLPPVSALVSRNARRRVH